MDTSQPMRRPRDFGRRLSVWITIRILGVVTTVKFLRSMLKIMLTLLVLGALGLAIVVVLGSIRYGGAEMFVRRVQAEIAPYRPHPDFVPTPRVTVAARDLDNLIASAGPTATPSPTSVQEPTATPPATSAGTTPDLTPGATRALDQAATPAVTPTFTPPPTATSTPAYAPAAASVHLTDMTHAWQTWNNCGPATLAMNLSYYECDLTQAQVAAALRPDSDDKNVSPEEMAAFARTQNLFADVMVNGDAGRLKLLLSNGVPVLIETWHEPEPNDGMGHYRLLVGYDDAAQQWIAYDSYESTGVDPDTPYAGIRFGYDTLDALWRVFNRAYLVVYDEARAPAVRDILGADLDSILMWQRANRQAQAEIQGNPDDPFGWFNLGMGLAAQGQYGEAATAFDHARQIGLPWRMLWYQFGPFEAYFETGRYDEVIALADDTLKSADNIEELHYWKGLAYQALGDIDAARAAWVRALELNGFYAPASEALLSLDEANAP
jgi:tetratricopeptide (TPR) repeat protein